jgi:hypothetical protein
MGKLVEKLRNVGTSSGGGMGFFGRARTTTRAARPAAIAVTLSAQDAAAAGAAVKGGADIVIVTEWKPGLATDTIKGALEGSDAVWGVEASDDAPPENLVRDAQEAGAAFAILGPSAPARLLLDDVEKFDLVVTVDPPKDDLSLLILRGENLLPAQAALLRARFTNADLTALTVADFARLRLVFEGLRFPVLATLREAPATANVRALVRMGCDALVLPGAGVDAAKLAEQVRALRDELEKIPSRPEDRGGVAIGGLMEASGASLPEQPARRGPTPEPEPEPEHE